MPLVCLVFLAYSGCASYVRSDVTSYQELERWNREKQKAAEKPYNPGNVIYARQRNSQHRSNTLLSRGYNANEPSSSTRTRAAVARQIATSDTLLMNSDDDRALELLIQALHEWWATLGALAWSILGVLLLASIAIMLPLLRCPNRSMVSLLQLQPDGAKPVAQGSCTPGQALTRSISSGAMRR